MSEEYKLPRWIVLSIIFGIVIMFSGVMMCNASAFISPDMGWSIYAYNVFKSGVVLRNCGVFIESLGLIGGAVIGNKIDRYLRISMLLAGAIIIGLLWQNPLGR